MHAMPASHKVMQETYHACHRSRPTGLCDSMLAIMQHALPAAWARQCWQGRLIGCMACAQLYSARTALAGCRTLGDMWSHQDSEQLHGLRDRLRLLQEQGVAFPRDSWPEKLLRAHPRRATPSPLFSQPSLFAACPLPQSLHDRLQPCFCRLCLRCGHAPSILSRWQVRARGLTWCCTRL